MHKLYEYKEILWRYYNNDYQVAVVPYCPVHKMELKYTDFTGSCETCGKTYQWSPGRDKIADFIRRKIGSEEFKDAEIISIDGIQTPQLKTKITIPEENSEYWMEARLNRSDKGRQLVVYIGEKGSSQKAQIFANIDQEKLSFDHKDRKPEEIFSKFTATFPSGKEITSNAPKKKN